ncbi:ABC transporter involved in cytochrome c biogenesis, ATPase component CcmA [hydrothermal vent metagenome]|uniref:ABC transporter involved in cytochrome c biogenesis, ATPase component CcmA n=1 Tax=hydrothermal vent metagenome TaxID=652676 RepID=A0A3B1BGL9_9ZZZZ
MTVNSSPPTREGLEIRNLSCSREDRTLFSGLSFRLTSGHAIQIEGPNGSGKTTLLRMLCGLRLADEGEIYWNGCNINEERGAFLSKLNYIGHAHGVKGELTPLENLRVSQAMAGRNNNNLSLDDALEEVGLFGFEDVPSRTLSAGQRRRVALARLLINPAPLWILDEPFTAIDIQGQQQIETMITQHVLDGGMAILTSHHPLDLSEDHLSSVNLAT